MANRQRIWWRPEGRSPFSLDPSSPRGPQILSIVGQCINILGGPLLFVIAAKLYPFLIENRTLYVVGLGSIVVLFFASFVLFRDSAFPRGIQWAAKLLFRAGWGLSTTGLLLGLGLIANGYGAPLISREAAVVSKRQTLERDPSRRAYYIAVRAWPNSRTVIELSAPREIYDRLHVPLAGVDTPQPVLDAMTDAGQVRLVLCDGRLGVECLRRIELP